VPPTPDHIGRTVTSTTRASSAATCAVYRRAFSRPWARRSSDARRTPPGSSSSTHGPASYGSTASASRATPRAGGSGGMRSRPRSVVGFSSDEADELAGRAATEADFSCLRRSSSRSISRSSRR